MEHVTLAPTRSSSYIPSKKADHEITSIHYHSIDDFNSWKENLVPVISGNTTKSSSMRKQGKASEQGVYTTKHLSKRKTNKHGNVFLVMCCDNSHRYQHNNHPQFYARCRIQRTFNKLWRCCVSQLPPSGRTTNLYYRCRSSR